MCNTEKHESSRG